MGTCPKIANIDKTMCAMHTSVIKSRCVLEFKKEKV